MLNVVISFADLQTVYCNVSIQYAYSRLPAKFEIAFVVEEQTRRSEEHNLSNTGTVPDTVHNDHRLYFFPF